MRRGWRILRPWLPALAWAATLFALSARSTLPSPRSFGITDKVAHFIAYGVLGAALAWGQLRWRAGSAGATRRRVPHAAVITAGLLYGLSDELHQAFVPGRTPELLDAVADFSGVVVGYTLVLAVAAFRRRLHERRRAALDDY